MPSHYQEISNLTTDGKAAISSMAFVQTARMVLEDMPNVSLDPKYKANKDSSINIKVNKPIAIRFMEKGPTIFIHVSIKKDENATGLCQEIQKEIIEQIASSTEIVACNVDVIIDGIMY